MSETRETRTEVRVVTFPPDEPIRMRKARDLEHARELAAELADDAPLIESREVGYGPWRIVDRGTWIEDRGMIDNPDRPTDASDR